MKDIKITIERKVLDETTTDFQGIQYTESTREVQLGRIMAYDTISAYIDATDNLSLSDLSDSIDTALSEVDETSPYSQGVRLGYQECKSLIESLSN